MKRSRSKKVRRKPEAPLRVGDPPRVDSRSAPEVRTAPTLEQVGSSATTNSVDLKPQVKGNPLFPVFGPKQKKLEEFMRWALGVNDPTQMPDYDEMCDELTALSSKIGFVPAWVALFAGLNVAFDLMGNGHEFAAKVAEKKEIERDIRSLRAQLWGFAPRKNLNKVWQPVRDWVSTHAESNEPVAKVAARVLERLMDIKNEIPVIPDVDPGSELFRFYEHFYDRYGRLPSKRQIERRLSPAQPAARVRRQSS